MNNQFFVFLFTLILGFGGLTSAQAQNRLGFLLDKLHDGGKSDYVMIIAHRGDWRNAPENSMQAYKDCIDAGMDGIEIDVHMTKDSAIVMTRSEASGSGTTPFGQSSTEGMMMNGQ